MAKIFEAIDERMVQWIGAQHMFFVASAPLAAAGHVNLSPKALDSFRVLGPREVAYVDLTGSGAETAAHLRENGRIVLMFCAFEGPPRIVRLHGRGSAIEPGAARFEALAARMPRHASTRALIHVDVQRIADSCGYAVPLMEFQSQRKQLDDWVARKQASEGLAAYRAEWNVRSIDGLPALDGGT